MKYRKKPIVIDAIQWNGKNMVEIADFAKDSIEFNEIRQGDAENKIPAQYDLSIKTLEGIMQASIGDYIIKGINGEFYACKPEIFEKTYEKADNSLMMNFGNAIEALKQGNVIRRRGWNGKNIYVFKQVPAHIDGEIVPKMQSLPVSAKNLILSTKGSIDYTNQCLIYNKETGRADSWVPSISDVFAEDWEIVSE